MVDAERFQPVAVVNYPDPRVPYTRITEYKHLTGQSQRNGRASPTNIRRAEGDPYYPVPRAGESGAVQEIRGARARPAERDLRRPARHLPLLQYGPGGGPGARRRSASSTSGGRLQGTKGRFCSARRSDDGLRRRRRRRADLRQIGMDGGRKRAHHGAARADQSGVTRRLAFAFEDQAGVEPGALRRARARIRTS